MKTPTPKMSWLRDLPPGSIVAELEVLQVEGGDGARTIAELACVVSRR